MVIARTQDPAQVKYPFRSAASFIMFNIVLVHPEIPPNTGNIIRLSGASTGCRLHS